MHPGLVLCPVLTNIGGEASQKLCEAILTIALPLIPDNRFSIVDVCEAAGNRYILVSETLHLRDVA